MTLDVLTLPLRDRRTRPLFNGVMVLVFCEGCDRFISDEDRHHCIMPPEMRSARMRKRVVKHREVGHE